MTTNRFDDAISAMGTSTEGDGSTDVNQSAEDNAVVEDNANEGNDHEEGADKNGADEDGYWPKKAVNAISRRDKTIGKLRGHTEHLMSRIQQLEQAMAQSQSQTSQNDGRSAEPREQDYDNYGEYLKAVAKFEARQELNGEQQRWQEQQQRANQEQQFRQQQEWVAERENVVVEQANAARQAIPDFQNVLLEHADVMDDMPKHVELLFLQSENAALAFYNLAKEGKLEALMAMPPARAAMEIGRAQNAKPKVSKAPAPLSASKGTASGAKPLHMMDSKELKNWLAS